MAEALPTEAPPATEAAAPTRATDRSGCPVDHRALAEQAAEEACPVDHRALAEQAAQAGCPVDHGAGAPRPSSTCAYAPGAAKRGYLVPGLIAFLILLVGGAILNVTDFSHGASGRLGGSLVASQIASAWQGSHQGAALPGVTCPADEPVGTGITFTCRLTPAGGPAQDIEVTETGGGRFGFAPAG